MRAQISVDFIIASIIVMILFTLIFGLYAEKNKGIGTVMSSLEAERVGEKIAWNVNDVARGGDGARSEVIVPEMILGEEYYIYINDRWIEVTWQHGGVENHLSVPLMTNSTESAILEPGRSLVVENKGGVIYVS